MARPVSSDDTDFGRQNEVAIREAREADRIEPRAAAVSYDSRHVLVLVELRSGFAFGFPAERVAGLAGASAKQLVDVRISPSGDGLHWDQLDVDVSLTGLVTSALNLRDWAPRLMGRARSKAKARAARIKRTQGWPTPPPGQEALKPPAEPLKSVPYRSNSAIRSDAPTFSRAASARACAAGAPARIPRTLGRA